MLAAALPAHADLFSWQGDLFVTNVNDPAACSAIGLNIGTFGRGVFRPKGLGTNGTVDLLAFHMSRSAFHLAPTGDGNLHQATAATVHYLYGSGGFRESTNVALSGVTVAPNSGYTENTATFKIKLQVKNIFPPQVGPSGCNATFQGTLARRLN